MPPVSRVSKEWSFSYIVLDFFPDANNFFAIFQVFSKNFRICQWTAQTNTQKALHTGRKSRPKDNSQRTPPEIGATSSANCGAPRQMAKVKYTTPGSSTKRNRKSAKFFRLFRSGLRNPYTAPMPTPIKKPLKNRAAATAGDISAAAGSASCPRVWALHNATN